MDYIFGLCSKKKKKTSIEQTGASLQTGKPFASWNQGLHQVKSRWKIHIEKSGKCVSRL